MPNPLKASGRARAAIAAVVALSTSIGGVLYVKTPGGQQIPAAVVLASNTLVKPWEGEALKAYLDRVAKPPIWTICDGDTQNVRPGMVETPAGCNNRLVTRMTQEFYPALQKCVVGFDHKPLSWQAMMLSLSWNIGSWKACHSDAADYGRRNLFMSSCVAATRYNKAGGKVIIGLKKRRENGDAQRIGEAELCVSGLEIKEAK
ncbi:glycoside hydrolase [Mesorhizobium sp. VK22B]|uniref:Lysozyme n=1 Tax=Mesorhizobium captivum TaxID=3072319 RepID=A0ABU4ZA96_9HYPH|nr:glycoside hydrolase family protein [Mesorhizobium sp. VK22B]MDX8495903.1 glycoside hydrolase [Mesorhizobium sp. VK22B]